MFTHPGSSSTIDFTSGTSEEQQIPFTTKEDLPDEKKLSSAPADIGEGLLTEQQGFPFPQQVFFAMFVLSDLVSRALEMFAKISIGTSKKLS
mmetsp:Transcript_45526/g.88943  ORF Transcript_45526/g.88943 Transcript_45526/m.88943 type:complete len:92 (+) Transcript_45526:2599-2874(+)